MVVLLTWGTRESEGGSYEAMRSVSLLGGPSVKLTIRRSESKCVRFSRFEDEVGGIDP